MTNRLGVARAALTEALDAVLPGRTGAREQLDDYATAPGITVGYPRVSPSTSGRSTLIVASFPVRIVYDGAPDAQVDGLDDLVSKAWDALEAMVGVTPTNANPSTTTIAGQTLDSYDLTVDVLLAARTLCLAPVEAHTIPTPEEIPDV